MIVMSARLMDQINNAAQDAYPNECCGLLAGYGELVGDIKVTRVEASENVAEDGIRDRFEVDPKVRFDLMRALEGTDERIVGHYHSHPEHPAEPSDHDLKMAFEPDLLWLIVAVTSGQVSEARAFRVDDDANVFHETPLSII